MSRRRVVNVLNRIVVIVYVVDHLIGVVVVSLDRGDRDHGFLVGGLRRCRLRLRTPPVRSRSFHFGLGAALGASDRISMQVVEFPAATHTRVLGAPFPLCHVRASLLLGTIVAVANASLAPPCQNQIFDRICAA